MLLGLLFGMLTLPFLLLFGFRAGFSRQIIVAVATKKLIQHGKRGGLAVHIIIVMIAGVDLTEHIAHFIGQSIQIFIGEAHLRYRLIDLRNAQAPGTLDAVALVQGYPIFNFGNEHHGDVLFALCAKFGLHINHSLNKENLLFSAF
jgi:hypothetical protein